MNSNSDEVLCKPGFIVVLAMLKALILLSNLLITCRCQISNEIGMTHHSSDGVAQEVHSVSIALLHGNLV